MTEIKKTQQIDREVHIKSSIEPSDDNPRYKSRETPFLITGKLPDTPKGPPKKK